MMNADSEKVVTVTTDELIVILATCAEIHGESLITSVVKDKDEGQALIEALEPVYTAMGEENDSECYRDKQIISGLVRAAIDRILEKHEKTAK